MDQQPQNQPQQSQQPINQEFQPSPPQGEPLQPRQSDKNIWIYLFIGLVIVGGAFGFGWWQGRGSVPELTPTPTPTPTISPTSQATPTPSAGSTGSGQVPANWKTYRNDEYGFEFRYPVNLNVNLINEDSFYEGGVIVKDTREDGFRLIIKVKNSEESIDDLITYYTSPHRELKFFRDEITLGGSRAINVSACGDPGCYPEIYTINTGKQFLIYGFNYKYDKQGGGLLTPDDSDEVRAMELLGNQILSTFRFLE